MLGLGWWRRRKPLWPSPKPRPRGSRDPGGRPLALDNQRCDSFGIGDFKVTVLNTAPSCEQYLECCLSTPPKAIGLDCEWGGARGVPVALLQLAFPNKECVLVHLSEVGSVVPKLAEILSDRRSVLGRGHMCICVYGD